MAPGTSDHEGDQFGLAVRNIACSPEVKTMQIGIVGLGRMGANIARRLMKAGHACVVFDADPAARSAVAADGGQAAESLETLVGALASPAAVWLMLPAGPATETTVVALGRLLHRGDVIIDGGNAYYKDDIRRAKALAAL